MTARIYRCGNCGAQLHPTDDAQETTCTFCGTVTIREREAKPEPERSPERPSEPKRRTKEGDGKTKRSSNVMGLVASFGPIVVGAIVGLYLYLRPDRQWAGAPILVDIDGDGVEDVIGQWTVTERDKPRVVVGLVDGKTRRIVWTFAVDPKRGTSSGFPVALANRAIVAGGAKPEAYVLDSKTGKLLGTVDLPGKAHAIQARGGLAWVDTDDGKGVSVDVDTARVIAGASRPDWAPQDARTTCPHAICRPSWESPKITDMNIVEVRLDPTSDDAIAVGRKENGTHLPMLAGYSLSKKTVTWTHLFASPDTSDGGTPQRVTIARGRVYFEYSDAKSVHLAAVSASTGQVLWDVKRDDWRSASSIVVGATSIYVTARWKLLVIDPRSGEMVAKLF
jgi:outer membrane protein assembly factor BamB